MKQLFKLTWVLILGLLAALPTMAETPMKQNIKVGMADVAININIPESAGMKLENPTGLVINSSMFEKACENFWDENAEGILLTYDGKSITGKVPMELSYQWFNIILNDKATQMNMNLLVLLSQDQANVIDIDLVETEPYYKVNSNFEAYNKFNWQDWYTLAAIAQFMSNNPAYEDPLKWLPDSAYDSWKTAEKEYWGKMYTERMKYIIDFSKCSNLYVKAPAWVKNSSKWWFAAKYAMDYVAIAKMRNNLTVPEPPIEFYSFLSKIDFTDKFLTHFALQPQKVILDKILGISAADIKPIGDTPVKEWQAGVSKALSKAFIPTDLLLDMLAAQSYINQISEEHKALTAKQIENVKSGFGNDLGKIILNRNDKK